MSPTILVPTTPSGNSLTHTIIATASHGAPSLTETSTQDLGSDHTSDLAWVIPMVVGIIFVLVMLALLFYYGVRALELKITRCCYRACRCCAPNDGTPLGNELETLTFGKHHKHKDYQVMSHNAYQS